MERDNISFRLNSGRKQYVEKGGKLGRPTGSTKSQDKKREEYREVINLLNKGYAIRDVAKLTGKGIGPVLVDLFLHYVFDKWMQIHYSDSSFERYADDTI